MVLSGLTPPALQRFQRRCDRLEPHETDAILVFVGEEGHQARFKQPFGGLFCEPGFSTGLGHGIPRLILIDRQGKPVEIPN